jgi:hypothetical protein
MISINTIMSKIDLSKAKIGDKFRARCGCILVYVGKLSYDIADKYLLIDEIGSRYNFFKYGCYMVSDEHRLDLVEQVFDEPLSAMKRTERDERTNRDMQKIAEIADEEKQELQRRQEVVELADRIFFSERGSAYSFKECIEVAEHSVNMIKQYLKEGKLC